MGIRRLNKRKLTFITIMFMVVIIGILLSIPMPNSNKRLNQERINQARIRITKINMEIISISLAHYEMNVGNYPTTDQGLKSLVQRPEDVSEDAWGEEPYLEEGVVPKDGWKNDFLYESPGEHLPKYDLSSKGKDKTVNTKDDIHNWPEENEKDF